MFIDACAIVSIISRENDAKNYERALTLGTRNFTSDMAAWEASVILSRGDKLNIPFEKSGELVRDWLDLNGIELKNSDPGKILQLALRAASEYGTSRRKLSSFDCFHYAHAKLAGVPMLTLDKVLRETDLATLP